MNLVEYGIATKAKAATSLIEIFMLPSQVFNVDAVSAKGKPHDNPRKNITKNMGLAKALMMSLCI